MVWETALAIGGPIAGVAAVVILVVVVVQCCTVSDASLFKNLTQYPQFFVVTGFCFISERS